MPLGFWDGSQPSSWLTFTQCARCDASSWLRSQPACIAPSVRELLTFISMTLAAPETEHYRAYAPSLAGVDCATAVSDYWTSTALILLPPDSVPHWRQLWEPITSERALLSINSEPWKAQSGFNPGFNPGMSAFMPVLIMCEVLRSDCDGCVYSLCLQSFYSLDVEEWKARIAWIFVRINWSLKSEVWREYTQICLTLLVAGSWLPLLVAMGGGGCLGPPLRSPVLTGRFSKFKRHSFRLNMIYISKKRSFKNS